MCASELGGMSRDMQQSDFSADECPDGSHELCSAYCVPDEFTGRFTMTVWFSNCVFNVETYCIQNKTILMPIIYDFFRDVKKLWRSAFLCFGHVMGNLIVPKAVMKKIAAVVIITWWNI